MATAIEMIGQVETAYKLLEQEKARLVLEVAEKTAATEHAESRCRQLQVDSKHLLQQSAQEQLLAAEKHTAHIQMQYTECIRDLAAAKAARSAADSELAALRQQIHKEQLEARERYQQVQQRAAADVAKAAAAAAEVRREQDDMLGHQRRQTEAQAAGAAVAAANELKQYIADIANLRAKLDTALLERKTSEEALRQRIQQLECEREQQVVALMHERHQLLADLEKERRASSLNTSTAAATGWKTKLMAQKAELDRVKAERDWYKKICKQQQQQQQQQDRQ